MLGLRDYGLEDTATKVGGRTLLNDPDWMARGEVPLLHR